MPLFDEAKLKLRNTQNVIGRLLDGDFPLDSGEKALQRLMRVFKELDNRLVRAGRLQDQPTIDSIASQINVKIYQILPILGFIIRSTNVRNAFELVYPFQLISDALLQGRPRLILSSEWDYVPFAYPQSLDDLKNFVLIGMPATESGNALLAPLAAHELGHALWRNRGISGPVSTTLQLKCEALYNQNMQRFKKVAPEYKESDIVGKEILPESIGQSLDNAAYQAEEIFCDMFAYALFDISYVYAFAYILAPGHGRRPSPRYPSYSTRISTLQQIALSEGKTLPSSQELSLVQASRIGSAKDRFIFEMAECAVGDITEALWNEVKRLLAENSIKRPLTARSRWHLQQFTMGVPAHDAQCLGDILNAAWLYYRENILPQSSETGSSDLFHNLNELVLKTIEVLEYAERTGNGPQR